MVTDHGRARVVVPADAYAALDPWSTPELFLAALEALIRGPWKAYLRRTEKDATNVDSFMRWARREVAAADHRTGRGLQESVERVARDLGCSVTLVRRCRRVARALGIYRDVVAGRLLRLSERLEVHEAGSRQRGVTGERAFTVTPELRAVMLDIDRERKAHRAKRRPQRVSSAIHPRRGNSRTKTPGQRSLPRARKRAKNEKNNPEARFAGRSSTKAVAPGESLARDVVALLPFGYRMNPRHVAPLLKPYEEHGWPASELLAQCDRYLTGFDKTHPPEGKVRSPGGYLHWMLQYVIPEEYEPPPEQPERPGWCGACSDPIKRQIELDDGDRMQRCPRCHPLASDTYVSDGPDLG